MISKVYLVKYDSYFGYASTYEEALELEKQYKCYENSGANSITADEARDYRDKHKPHVLKSDNCLSAAKKETDEQLQYSWFEYCKHKASNTNYDDVLKTIL